MSHRSFYLAAVALALVGCTNSTEVSEVGQLRTAIIAGQVQSVIAGAPRIPDYVVGQAQRVPLSASLTIGSANATANVTFLPNVVMCVGEEQMDLIPFARCINTDAQGNGRFTFSPTTKAGSYRAKINFTMGREESTVDSVLVTVVADTPDTLLLFSSSWVFTTKGIPVGALVQRIRDKYGNSVAPSAAQVSDTGLFSRQDSMLVADSVERSSAVVLYAGIRSGATRLSSIRDLRSSAWQAIGRCGPAGAPIVGFQKGSDNVDSITFDLKSRSVEYVSLTSSSTPVVRIVWDGVERFHLSGGKGVVVDTLKAANDSLGQRRSDLAQRPDSLGTGLRTPNAGWSYARTQATIGGACLTRSLNAGAFTLSALP